MASRNCRTMAWTDCALSQVMDIANRQELSFIVSFSPIVHALRDKGRLLATRLAYMCVLSDLGVFVCLLVFEIRSGDVSITS